MLSYVLSKWSAIIKTNFTAHFTPQRSKMRMMKTLVWPISTTKLLSYHEIKNVNGITISYLHTWTSIDTSNRPEMHFLLMHFLNATLSAKAATKVFYIRLRKKYQPKDSLFNHIEVVCISVKFNIIIFLRFSAWIYH